MGKGWPIVHLGRVVSHRKEFVTIDDTREYKRCRVQLHAKGIVLRDIIAGVEIKTKQQQVCRAGEFLVAEIDAKVGGFGVLPEDLDGAIVSSHYFLFTIDDRQLDRRFLDYFIRTPAFREQVNAQGSTNYAAIRPAHVLSYAIPLPPLAEQRRIVAKVEELAAKIEEARALRRHASDEVAAFAWHVTAQSFPEPCGTKVGDFVRFQTGYAFKSEWFTDEGVRLARNVNVGHGILDWSQTVRLPISRQDEFNRFDLQTGDILVSLDRPIISAGVKVARVSDDDLPCLLLQRVARAQFDEERLDGDYLFHWLRSPRFVAAIDPGRSNGVPHISHKDIERIPFQLRTLAEQRRIVAYLDDLQAKVDSLKAIQAQSAAELNALLPSILDKAFKGEL